MVIPLKIYVPVANSLTIEHHNLKLMSHTCLNVRSH